MREALKPEDLAEFAIEGEDERFAQAVGKGGPAAGALVSVKVWPALTLRHCVSGASSLTRSAAI